MIYSLHELKCKEVINIENGEKLGFIDDIDFEYESGSIVAFVIFGRKKLWGMLGKENDIILSCRDIELIGKDTILIKVKNKSEMSPETIKKFSLSKLFEKN